MTSVADAIVNPIDSASIFVERELARVADRLRHVTVQVSGASGGGSGVIWRPDGLIVTNAHVASRQEQVVTLQDGRTFAAELIARDRRHDLASLKIAASGLNAAEICNPASLRIGELVLAMGNPMGEIGALAKGILHASPSSGWVTADIRLAPGNSGGPLADAHGRVIGINSMIANGLAVAVSSNVVERFMTAEQSPRLGVTVHPVQIVFRESHMTALQVMELEPNSAAHLFGVMIGDLILRAGGIQIGGVEQLAEAISAASSSRPLALEILRAGAMTTCSVEMGRG